MCRSSTVPFIVRATSLIHTVFLGGIAYDYGMVDSECLGLQVGRNFGGGGGVVQVVILVRDFMIVNRR